MAREVLRDMLHEDAVVELLAFTSYTWLIDANRIYIIGINRPSSMPL